MFKKILIYMFILCNLSVYADNNQTQNTINTNTYIFNGDSIYNAIKTIVNQEGMELVVDNEVLKRLKLKKISAKFTDYNYVDLMNRLGKIYGFEWFYYTGTLYITDKKYLAREFNIYSANMKPLYNLLKSEGLPVDQFAYSEIPSENKIIITGPIQYLDIATQRINKLQLSGTSQQFAIYRLKYASATDVYLNYNNTMVNSVLSTPQEQQIVVPGIATILQNLQNGGNNAQFNSQQAVEPIKNSINSPIEATASMNNLQNTNNTGGTTKLAPVSTISNIQADQRLNAIIIRDTPENLEMYKNIIAKLDVPTPLISIELLIVELNDSKLNEQGISWWAGIAGFNPAALSNVKNSRGLVSAYGNVMNNNNMVINNAKGFVASVQFLEDNGLAKTLGKPTLTTIDNIPATATVGQSAYINPNVANQPTNAAYQSITGIAILPHVIVKDGGDEDQVKVTVALLDGDLPQFGVSFPTMFQGSINSQAVLKNNQSLLLASYNKKREENYENKVPFLGDIPLLGYFFKTSVTATYNATNLYLITPKVLWVDMQNQELKKEITVNGGKINLSVLDENQLFESANYQQPVIQPESTIIPTSSKNNSSINSVIDNF